MLGRDAAGGLEIVAQHRREAVAVAVIFVGERQRHLIGLDDVVGGVRRLHLERQLQADHMSAVALGGARRLIQRGMGVGRRLLGPGSGDEGEARRLAGIAQVEVAPGDGPCSKSEVGDAGGEQADRIERPGEGLHADGWQELEGRLVAGDAAEGGRPDHRAACLSADRERQHAGRDRRRRTRRRAARRVPGMVRIARHGRVQEGKFGGRGLAGDQAAGMRHHAHDCGIRRRPVAVIDGRAASGGEIDGVDNVLDADPADRPGGPR
jgi:hypothetical protein